jgi:hypothetical protein
MLVEDSGVPFEESNLEVFWIVARKNLPMTARRSNNIFSWKTRKPGNGVVEPAGAPRSGAE